MKRILVVDDEPDIRETLGECLALLEPPVEVASACDGEEAREMLRETPFDMVITDDRMPRLRGTELLRWLRRERPEVVRVLMTAHTESSAVQEAMAKARAVLLVPKPFGLQETLPAIAEVLHGEGDREKPGVRLPPGGAS